MRHVLILLLAFSMNACALLRSGNTSPEVVSPYNALRLKVRTILPAEVITVRDATAYLLTPTGYQLVASPAAAAITNRPVQPAAAPTEILSIEDTLLLLIGEDNRLVVDHSNKLIGLEAANPTDPRIIERPLTPLPASPSTPSLPPASTPSLSHNPPGAKL